MKKVSRHHAISFLCGLIILFLYGCGGNNLSRDEAKNQLVKKLQLPSDIYQNLETRGLKERGYYFKNKTTGERSTNPYDGPQTFQMSNLFSQLQNEGLITIAFQRTEQASDLWYGDDTRYDFYEYYIANFTQKARPFVNGSSVKVATLKFGEVTGIIENKDSNTAQVEYTVKQSDITPFGSALNTTAQTFNRSATFTKYDDGWRVSN